MIDALAELPDGACAQVAGEVFGTPQYGGAPLRATAARRGAVRLRCASVLKPLLVWAAGGPADGEQAIRHSDNAATNRVWHGAGPPRILDRLADATGVRWRPAGADPTWFGGIEVSATELVTAYGALARAATGDPAAARVLGWMRAVAPEQAFGVPDALAAALGVDAAAVAVKAGWFGHPDETALRTHAAAVAERDGEIVVVAALTALPRPDVDRDRYRRDVHAGRDVGAVHERLAGRLLRDLVGATCRDLARLGGR
ncbi:MAG TPA: serine hydrolase [Pseudonocardia sp.]|nr:serine hydrolase [Pseudonocardia sp.]